MRLEEHAVPSRVARASGKPWPPRGVVESGDTVDQVAVALPEPRTVLAMLGDNLEIQMLAEVELSDKSFAAVTLIFGSRSGDGDAVVSEPTGGGLARHYVKP